MFFMVLLVFIFSQPRLVAEAANLWFQILYSIVFCMYFYFDEINTTYNLSLYTLINSPKQGIVLRDRV